MKAFRPIGHEDRISVIDHLDELRNRLIVCGAMLLVAFLVCFAFNNTLIHILNAPLPHQPNTGIGSQLRQDSQMHRAFKELQHAASTMAAGAERSRGASPQLIAGARGIESAAGALASAVESQKTDQEKPVTFGVGEPFTATLIVVGYFAVLISLPVMLYQLYAFVLPALRPDERRVAVPAMVAAPLLFIAGVVFTYFEVLTPAVHFLQGYNSDQFQVLVGAGPLYKFEVLLMAGIGLAFQVPLLLLALQKAGVITASTLTVNWRYAVVIIAVIAAALPGVDPVTMALETLPLIVLYLASIVLLRFVEHRAAKRAAAEYVSASTPHGFDADTGAG